MTRYDPLPTHDNDINTTTATPQPRSSSSPNSNNHQRLHIPSSDSPLPQVLSSSSSSSPTSTLSSFYVGNNRLNNNTANSNNSSFFPDFTNAIRTRASSIISTSTSPNSSQRSSYSDHGSESSAPHMPLLPQANINSLSPSQLEAGLAHLSTSLRDSNDTTKGTDSLKNRNCYCCKPSTSTTRITPRHVIRLRWIWVLVLLAGEHGTFWVMVNRCSWPESSSWDTTEESLLDRYRMAIIADPQLTDWMSYHQSGLLLALVEMYTDIYMKRSFRRLHASLRPDAVLFLGDLNDGGRNTDQKTFEKNTGRFFEWIFATDSSAWNQGPIVMDALDGETAVIPATAGAASTNSNNLRKRQSLTEEEKALNEDITGHYVQRVEAPLDSRERLRIRDSGQSLRLYVAGNHDVGFGDTLIRSSMKRYKRVFGSVNYEVNVGNHSLVVLDTLALSSKVPSIREESQLFLDQIKLEQPSLPRILFTHVPLHRLDTTYCGKARETDQTIKDRKGEQYQNMVSIPLTREILEDIQPDMVFSGDDHDWCEIAHPTIGGNFVPEVTLRTFSFAQGIKRPAFGMLSLFNPDQKPKNVQHVVGSFEAAGLPVSREFALGSVERPSGDTTFVYDECMLPDQLLVYICYGALFAVSLSWILIRRFQWMSISRQRVRESSILGRWRKIQSAEVTTASSTINNISENSIGSSSSRADQQLDDTTFEEKDAYYDEPIGPLSLGAAANSITTAEGKKQLRRRWSLLMRLFWERVVRDLWDVIRYVVPFYVFLFVCSII